MVILLMLLIQVRSNCCLNCTTPSSSECLECGPGYYRSNFTCVSVCGYGFFVNGTSCDRNTGSNTFIQTDFSQIYLYSVAEAGNFKTSNNLALVEPGNMVPTYDRGFYSDGVSNLIGKSSWIPNTELTIKITFRPLTPDGIIFQAFNTLNESFIKLSLVNGYLQLEALTIDQATESTQVQTLSNTNLHQSSDEWFVLKVLFGQVSSTSVKIDLGLYQGTNQLYISNSEMKITEMQDWVLGDINKISSVQGFYYTISVTNSLLGESLGSVSISLCSVFYFKNMTDDLCYSCPNCNSRLTCVDDTICSLCYSNQCSSCDGFYFGVCNSCSNSETSPYCCPYLCRKCEDLSSCIECQNGMYIYEGICIDYNMYLTSIKSDTPLKHTKFDSGFKGLYDVFKTGEQRFKYQFFNSPESKDPIPAKHRGLYFNGISYMKNFINLNFHPIFSVNLIIKPSSSGNMTILNIGGIFQLQPFLNSFVSYLQTEDSNRAFYYADSITEYQNWVSLSVSLSYTYPYSTFSIYKDNVLILTNSVAGVFRQANNAILIAYNSVSFQPYGSNFIGFLYSYTYWNSPISDFSQYSILPICSLDSDRNCLSTCEIYEFLNSTGSCTNCSESCTLGCIKENSCNICQDRLCSVCDDFYNNCTLCTTNANKVGDNCICIDNSIDFNDTCELCDASCSACQTLLTNGCEGCADAGKLLAGGICYNICPDGFEVVLGECEYKDGIVLNLSFYEQYLFSSIGEVLIGSSSNAEIDSNDPVPDPYRGYYFTLDKYMEKAQALIYYEFSMSFWIKIYSEGSVVTHGNFNIISASGIIYNQIPLNSGDFSVLSTNSSQEWTHIIIELDCGSNNISTHSLYKSFILISSFTFPENVFFIDSSQSILIGGNSSFTGFLWMIFLNNSAPATISSTLSLCSTNCSACTTEQICLSDCDFQRPADNCSAYCGLACLNCYSSTQCQRCESDGTLTSGTCECPTNFIWTDSYDECFFPCFSSCITCDSKLTGSCYTCADGHYLINNACVYCPVGYSGTSCAKERDLSFDLILNEIVGIVVDKAGGIKGTTGLTSQFYPDYDEKDPIFALFRGFYFDMSFIVFDDKTVLFPPEFTVELWFLPNSPNGVIFSKSLEGRCLFEVSLDLFSLKFSFSTYSYGILEFNNTDSVSGTEWNFVQIFVKNIQNIDFQVSSCINYGQVQFHYIIEMNYVEDLYSGFLIGSRNGKDAEYYTGFLYEVKIFNVFIENLYYGCEEGCLMCSSIGECLPNCSISTYWQGGEYFNCQACDPGCLNGCRDNRQSCNLCLDDLCSECTDSDVCDQCQSNSTLDSQGKCECNEGFTNQSYYCEYCDIGYVDNDDCVHCTEGCVACDSNGCLNCTEHAEYINSKCSCVLGYNYENSVCNFVNFTVVVSVSLENFIYLDFSEGLEENLVKSELNLFIDNNTVDFKFSQYTDTRYAIDPYIDFDVDNTSIAKINFLRPLISKKNGLIVDNSTEFLMNKYSTPKPNALMQTFKSFSTKFSTYATYGVTASAIFNPTPASLWSFINSIQMLVYLYLFEINLDRRVSGYLIGLKKYNLFPNVFEYLNINYGKPHRFSRAEKLGFDTNSILMNSGQWISCFLFFITVYYVFHWTCLMLKNTRFEKSWIRNFLDNKCKGYKYGFFLRFWIQAYIEILVGCFIAFYSVDFRTVDQALNLYYSLLLSFFIVLTPIVSFSLGLIKKNDVKTDTANQELKLWGSLFYEFKEDQGAFRNQFYTVFFLRRFCFISIIFIFHDYPMIQLCIAEILMISMFLFILFKKPFNEPALNYANLITELNLALIIPISGTFSFSLSSAVRNIIDILLIVLINTIIFSQLAGSIFIFVKTIRIKLRNRKKMKVENLGENVKFNIQVQNIDVKYEDDVSLYSNHVNNSPAYSSVNSILSEVDFKVKNNEKSSFGVMGNFLSESSRNVKFESQPNAEKVFLGEEFKRVEKNYNRGSSL